MPIPSSNVFLSQRSNQSIECSWLETTRPEQITWELTFQDLDSFNFSEAFFEIYRSDQPTKQRFRGLAIHMHGLDLEIPAKI